MLEPCCSRPRRGATVVEFALICPAAMLLIFGLIVGGMGIFRYQEVSHLAREGARYASTHGANYQKEQNQTGFPAVASSDDLWSYLKTKTVLLDPSKLTPPPSVTWTCLPDDLPGIQFPNIPTYPDPNSPGQTKQNYVKVTVTYQWFPESFLIGPITLSSTSEMPMCY